jgi:hypothetical protein
MGRRQSSSAIRAVGIGKTLTENLYGRKLYAQARFTLEPAEIATPQRQASAMQVDRWNPELRRWLDQASRETGFDRNLLFLHRFA